MEWLSKPRCAPAPRLPDPRPHLYLSQDVSQPGHCSQRAPMWPSEHWQRLHSQRPCPLQRLPSGLIQLSVSPLHSHALPVWLA